MNEWARRKRREGFGVFFGVLSLGGAGLSTAEAQPSTSATAVSKSATATPTNKTVVSSSATLVPTSALAVPVSAAPALRPVLSPSAERAGVGYRVEREAAWLVSCAPACVERDGGFARVPLPEEIQGRPARAEVLPVGAGVELLHLVWGGDGGARGYHVLARGAPQGEGPPEILLRGFAGGDAEAQLLVLGDAKQKSVILGRRSAGALCGRDGWSDAQRYDAAAGEFVPTRLPVFGQSERKKAAELRAQSAPLPEGTAALELRLRSSVEVDTSEPTWTDGVVTERAGEPWGLLVTEVPAETRALVLKNLAASEGASLWLWFDGALHRVALPAAGGDVAIELPQKSEPRCVIVSEDGRPTALGEIEAQVAFAGDPSTEALIAALGRDEASGAAEGGSPESRVVESALAVRGEEAGILLARAYGRLSVAARRRALAVAEELEGASGARVELVAWGLASGSERALLEEKLALRGASAGGAFEGVFAEASPKLQAELAPLYLRLAPRQGAQVLVPRLAQESPARRRVLRESLEHALADSVAGAAVREVLLAELTREGAPRRVKVEILRALRSELGGERATAEAVFASLLGEEPPPRFEELYVLIEPLVIWGESSPAARRVQAELLGERPALGLSQAQHEAWLTRFWEVVAAPGAAGKPGRETTRAAFPLLEHPSVRVRVGVANFLGEHGPKESTSRLVPLLEKDAWPLAREASAWALGGLAERGATPEAGSRALRDALEDDTSERVRRAAARALRSYPDEKSLRALRDALEDDASPRVRAEAALSLGRRCDVASLDRLTELAVRLQAPLGDGEVEVSLAALVALVTLDPFDREERLAPLRKEGVPGPLKAQIERTIVRARPSCGARPNAAR